MKKLILGLLALGTLSAQANIEASECRLEIPKNVSSRSLKILQKKFVLVKRGLDSDFKLNIEYERIGIYEFGVVTNLTSGQDEAITTQYGYSNNSLFGIGGYETALRKSLRKLPKCQNGSLRF